MLTPSSLVEKRLPFNSPVKVKVIEPSQVIATPNFVPPYTISIVWQE